MSRTIVNEQGRGADPRSGSTRKSAWRRRRAYRAGAVALLVAVAAVFIPGVVYGQVTQQTMWSPIDPQPNAGRIHSISVDPSDYNRFVAATDPTGPFDNLDTGASPHFSSTPGGIIPNVHVEDTAYGAGCFYVMPEQGHIWQRCSGSSTWSENSGNTNAFKGALGAHPSLAGRLVRGGRTFVDQNGNPVVDPIQYSSDFGAVWTSASKTPTGPIITDIEFSPTASDVVWASTARCLPDYDRHCGITAGKGIIFSTDSGRNWSDPIRRNLLPDPRDEVNSIAVVNDDKVFVATDGGFFLCQQCRDANNRTWTDLTPIRSGPIQDVFYACSDVSACSTIAIGTKEDNDPQTQDGVFLGSFSVDSVTWDRPPGSSGNGFPEEPVSGLGGVRGAPSLLYAGFSFGPRTVANSANERLWRTTDGGGNAAPVATGAQPFERLRDGFGVQSIAIKPDDEGTAYFATTCQLGVWRYETPSAGAGSPSDWTYMGFHYPMRVVTDPSDNVAVWTGATGGLERFNGSAWELILNVGHPHAIGISVTNPQHVYTGSGHGIWPGPETHPSRIWRSLDGGTTWGPPDGSGGIGVEINSTNVPGWIDMTETSLYDMAVSPLDENVAYVATFGREQRIGQDYAQGVLRTTDGGTNWRLFRAGLSPSPDCVSASPNSNLPAIPCSWFVGRVISLNAGGQEYSYIATLDGAYRYAPPLGDTGWVNITANNCSNCPTETQFETVAADPLDPFHLFIGSTRVSGQRGPVNIYEGRSTDGGRTWQWEATNLPLPAEPAWSPVFRARDIAIGVNHGYAAVTGAGVYKFDRNVTCTQALADFTTVPSPPRLNPNPPSSDLVSFQSGCIGCRHLWLFGDGRQSTLPGPTHPYANPGFYTVTHFVSLDGTTNWCATETKTDYVHVFGDPTDPTADDVTFVVGIGPDPGNQVSDTARGFRYDRITLWGTPTSLAPYGPRFGTNVAAGRLDPCRDDPTVAPYLQDCGGTTGGPIPITTDRPARIVTGAGPSEVFGPHVRAFRQDNSPIPKISFFAYGTLRYGANVGTANFPDHTQDPTDAGETPQNGTDTAAEILTGAGPGAVFGPHVRGWNYDGGPLSAINRISFFAYGTLKWGVNVAGANVEADPPCTNGAAPPCDPGVETYRSGPWDEILTGPGPGPVFGPVVRGFRFDRPNNLEAIAKINFNAYPEPEYGVKVTGGDLDLDSDRADEIGTGRGPIPTGGQQGGNTSIRAWKFSGVLTRLDTGNLPGGTEAFQGLTYGVNVAIGMDDFAAGTPGIFLAGARAPTEPPHVKGFNFDGSILARIQEIDFFPWGDYNDLQPGYGATVASVPVKERFFGAFTQGIIQTNQELQVIRSLVAGTPDSQTIDYSLDPEATVVINEWSDDAEKAAALSDLDYVLDNMADLSVPTILTFLGSARSHVTAGLLNDFARDAILQAIDALIARYQSGELCSGAVVARVPLAQAGEIVELQTSPLAPDSLFIAASSGTSFSLSEVSLSSFDVEGQETFEGSIHDLDVSVAGGCLLGIRCGDPASPPGELCPTLLKQPLGKALGLGVTSQELDLAVDGGDLALGAPSPRRPRGAAAALAHCGTPGGQVVALLEDLAKVPGSPRQVLSHGTPAYHAFTSSPIPGDARVFAIHDGGIDVIDLDAGTIQEMAIPGVSGEAVVAVDGEDPVLVALDVDSETITFLDPLTGAVEGQVVIPGAIDILPLRRRDRIITLTGDKLVLTDGGGRLRRELPICPGASGFAVTADGTRVLVSNSLAGTIDVVLVGSEDVPAITRDAAAVFEALPDEAFSIGQALFACDSVQGSGQASVGWDGFEADAGHIVANNSVDLSGNAFVNGDVTVGPSGKVKVKGNAVVTGSISESDDPFGCTPLDLAKVRSRLEIDNDNASVPATAQGRSVWEGSPAAGDFEVSEGDSAELPEGSYYMTSLDVEEGSQVTATGPVTIFLAGELEVKEQSRLVAAPGPVLVLSDTSGKHKLDDSRMEMVFYSPSARLHVSGGQGTELAGAAWVEEAKLSGQALVTRTRSLEAGALRAWLTAELLRIADAVEVALVEPDPLLRNAQLDQAIDDAGGLLLLMDGFFGGDPDDDWIRELERQQLLRPVLQDLIRRYELRRVEIPGPPPVVP